MSRHCFKSAGSIALCQSGRFILAKSLSFLRHRTVTGSNPIRGKVIFSFVHKIRFCAIIIFYHYRDITSMDPRNPWTFDFILYHFLWKLGKNCLKNENFKKNLDLSIWNLKFSNKIFLKFWEIFFQTSTTLKIELSSSF